MIMGEAGADTSLISDTEGKLATVSQRSGP